MASSTREIIHDFPPLFKVYKDGQIERYVVLDQVPAGVDPDTGVQIKDVLISPETGVKARIFLPKLVSPNQKLPLLVHYHGGGFCIGSAFDILTFKGVTPIVTRANMIAVSIDYRLAPENPLPIGFDDSVAGLQWVASHSNGLGPEPWLNEFADFDKVFLGGGSAGATIAHHVGVKAGTIGFVGLKIIGGIMVHPFFGRSDLVDDKLYKLYLYPSSSSYEDDPNLNPEVDPNLPKLVFEKVLVCVAEKDSVCPRKEGVNYYKTLRESEWKGEVELYETIGEDHCFHLFKSNEEKEALITKMVDFVLA